MQFKVIFIPVVKQLLKSFFLASIFGIGILLTIHGLKAYLEIPNFILPEFKSILKAFTQERVLLWQAFCTTGLQAITGFLLAVFIGSILSAILAVSSLLRTALYPWILFIKITPAMVLAPIVVLWLGPGLWGVSCIAFLVCFFPIIVNTTFGLISTPPQFLELFKSLRASKLQTFFNLKLPYALPYFLQGLRIAAVTAPIGAITGDIFIGGNPNGIGGLGFLIITYYAQMKIPALYATAFTTCSLGLLIVGLVQLINWKFLHKWHSSWRKTLS